jgi:hypothetical protein
MFNGTSMAAPQAAGGAALLLSAAYSANDEDEDEVLIKPAQLRQAIYSSTRLLDTSRIQVFEQGNGLMDVGAAWNLLRQNIKTTNFTSQVPVNGVLEDFLVPAGIGSGIYDRPVEESGSYTRTYTFRRSNGGGGNKTYNVSWVGNDGTFSSAGSVVLPLNTNVSFDVMINPTSVGAHSAILNLDDPKTVGIDYQTMNVVVKPETFTAGNNYTVVNSGTIGRNQILRYFFEIPANTPAFKVDLTGGGATPGTGQIRFLRYHPYGISIDSNASTSCYDPSAGTCSTGSPTSRTLSNPFPGVWEVIVEARRTSDTASAPFTLTASILGATVAPNPDNVTGATVGTPIDRPYTITNQFGAFTGRAVGGGSLGSAFVDRPNIANLAVQDRLVTVAAGSTSFRATIGGTSDPAADLDLYVYRCTGVTADTCTILAGQSADGDSEESVTITPMAATYMVRVEGYAVPAGNTDYNYVDVFVNAAFGSINITDPDLLRPAGSSWGVTATITPLAVPDAGRILLGNVLVRTSTNILVGSGEVRISFAP